MQFTILLFEVDKLHEDSHFVDLCPNSVVVSDSSAVAMATTSTAVSLLLIPSVSIGYMQVYACRWSYLRWLGSILAEIFRLVVTFIRWVR